MCMRAQNTNKIIEHLQVWQPAMNAAFNLAKALLLSDVLQAHKTSHNFHHC